jgi:two-component system response regulator NreC
MASPEAGFRLVVLDERQLIRHALSQLFAGEDGVSFVVGAGSAAEVPDATGTIDVVIASIGSETDVSDLVASIRERFPGAAILALSRERDPALASLALDRGAAGFISTTVSVSEAVDAVRRVGRGQRYVEAAVGAAVIDRLQNARNAEPLTPREIEVLRRIGAGYTNREIAQHMSVSVRTVESHRSRALKKLNLRTRSEVVRYCLEAGLLDGKLEQTGLLRS